MIKVIEGHRLNTGTATELAHYYNQEMGYTEMGKTLYQTKEGIKFMYGYGGALSEFGERVGNGELSEGEKIWLVSDEEAEKFIEENK